MNNSSLVSTPSSTAPSTLLDLRAVFGPGLTDQFSTYKKWIQPWINILAMVDNFAVVIIFAVVLNGWCACGRSDKGKPKGGGVALVSRIYYVAISFFELFNVGAGYIYRVTLTYLPFVVSNELYI